MNQHLCAAHAWLEVARRVDKMKQESGFLCVMIDGLFHDGVISDETRDNMKARIHEEPEMLLSSVAYSHTLSYEWDGPEAWRAERKEFRKARVLAALMFAHEAMFSHAESLGLDDLLTR